MPLMNFIAKSLPAISAAWLNAVDALKFTVFADATTKAAARAALTSDAPMAIGEGGTGGTTAATARAALGAAEDVNLVHLTGTETISGAKTYSGLITMSGKSIIEANASIAADATTMNPWSLGNYVTLTGAAVTFTNMAAAPQAGAEAELYMNAAHVWTDGAVFEVDGAANWTAEAGDRVLLRAKSTTVFTVHPRKKTGAPVAVPTASQGASVVLLGSYTPGGAIVFIVIGSSAGGGAGNIRIDWTAYDRYEIELDNISPASNPVNLLIQYYQDGGTTPLSATYSYASAAADSNTGTLSIASARGASSIVIAINATDIAHNAAGYSGILTITKPALTTNNKILKFSGAAGDDANVADLQDISGSGFYYGNTAAINGLKIFFSAGQLASGSVYVRGYKKS